MTTNPSFPLSIKVRAEKVLGGAFNPEGPMLLTIKHLLDHIDERDRMLESYIKHLHEAEAKIIAMGVALAEAELEEDAP